MSESDPLLPRRDFATTPTNTEDKANNRKGPLDISRSRRYGILAGLWSATFLSAMNQTLVPTMLPSISSEFNKFNQASWLGTSYLLATCTFTPLYGRLCNVLGRKGANHTALLFAAVGVLMCGLSSSMEMLILARFDVISQFSGIGGGGLMTTSSIVISDMYSMRRRGLPQGVASAFNGLGLGLGGPLGGFLTDRLGWRWAFLIQMPLFVVSYILTSWNLNYVTEGTGKSTREILKRIDYLGSGSLMMAVGSTLVFLSVRYNASQPWSNPAVIISVVMAAIFSVVFIFVEIFVAPEPMLAPFLLRRKIPVLVGISNFLVAICNFSIMYFFPMWFQTVAMTSASTAGMHLMPNSISMSIGSVFAGWVVHATGRYKTLNLILGACPSIGALLIYHIQEDSGPIQSWLSIIPLGFGNAVVLQTMLIALLAHVPDDYMAVATGFGQLFRGVGQVGGVAVSSAIFQSNLESELRKRIHTPDADKLITRIRQSAQSVGQLPPDLQRIARDSYAVSIKSVFFFAACSTMLSYIVRLPIPDKFLEDRPKLKKRVSHLEPTASTSATPQYSSPFESDNEDENDNADAQERKKQRHLRRLSTIGGADEILADLEEDHVDNTARGR
ncbi:hypothetical protein M413DRAFT_21980 [Hebeloma cylindrosporum]|uniref:Major facilitator superfamily (MFS) profile domain-containing protein n=1 Tax=Hebeloma cylindrosporum TaxID=76867 RepID=A0A0C2Z9N7_HEBCY|nr:hypothetical protein M413DRAFT_21980 [Hebeloma cylindrosporum h7]